MAELRRTRRQIAEINVVPYIDVMLVLLIIFMITAPLLTQGVNIELPEYDASVLPTDEADPIIVAVNAAGEVYLERHAKAGRPLARAALEAAVRARLSEAPQAAVLIRGDKDVNYGRVVEIMVWLRALGVSRIGLMTEPPEQA